MVYINAVGGGGAELPFGGVKAVRIGRELGRCRGRRIRQQEVDPSRQSGGARVEFDDPEAAGEWQRDCRGPACDRHDPLLGDGRRGEGGQWSSRAADGDGARRPRPLQPVPALRSLGSGLGRQGPLRTLGRARLDAPLCGPPPRRIRRAAGGDRRLPSVGFADPGHPEVGVTPGVETTTGPLGQGFANGVGMALAERFLRERYGADLVDHSTFAICSDGDLMEGVASEAASLAGHLGLGRLVSHMYDNEITIDGPTSVAFSGEDAGRPASAPTAGMYGRWRTSTIWTRSSPRSPRRSRTVMRLR